jgi:hypothetical protein
LLCAVSVQHSLTLTSPYKINKYNTDIKIKVDREEQKVKEMIYGIFLTFHIMKIAEYMYAFGM